MKYSIIIPIYNARETLRHCLDSVLSQSYPIFEVLMIDDGSTDDSAEIAASYAEKDERFVLIRQANAGPSSARNRGIDLARGDVIAFIDSDDFIEPDYLSNIHHAFEAEGAQIVFFGVSQIEKGTGKVCIRNIPELPQNQTELIVALTKADLFGYTWVKAISRQLIGQTRFDESLNLFEDEVFTCQIMGKSPKVSRISKPIYHQILSPGSLSKRTHQDYFRKCEAVYNAWKQLLRSEDGMQHPILSEKANHMAMVCKYYYLEKRIPSTTFAKGLADCSFFQDATVEDPLIAAIQNRQITFAQVRRIVYRMKVFLRNLTGR